MPKLGNYNCRANRCIPDYAGGDTFSELAFTRRAKRCIVASAGENTLSKSAFTLKILIPVPEIWRVMCQFIYPKLHIKALKLCISRHGSENVTRIKDYVYKRLRGREYPFQISFHLRNIDTRSRDMAGYVSIYISKVAYQGP